MKANAEMKQLLEEKDRTISRLLQQVNKQKKPPLNKDASREVRHATKKLKKEKNVTFDFNISGSHPHNAQIMNRIVEGAMDSFRSKNFSKQEAEEAMRRYFKNLKDEHMREINGKKEKHLRCMRRNSRMDTKLKMRLSGLQSKSCKLTAVQKQSAKQILHMDFMSSDEDEVQKSQDGTEYRNVRIIPWESNEARNIKALLLETHIDHVLGERDRKRMQKLRRDEGCAISERKCPDNAPQWACIHDPGLMTRYLK